MSGMGEVWRVLIVGSSTASYSEAGPQGSEYALLESYLGRARPETDWRCEAELIYLTRSVAERTLAAVHERRPDVVVLRLVGGNFFNEYVIERLRQISPLAYRWSRDVAEWLRRLGGGGPHGLDTPRGWIYRLPRWLMAKTLGTAPRIRVEEAIAVVSSTLDGLLQQEDLTVVVRLPSYPKTSDTNLKDYERRVRLFDRSVREYCERRRVPYYDWAEVRRMAGDERRIGGDGWHPVLDTRDLDARSMAAAVLLALDGPSEMRLAPSSLEAVGLQA
jgi:hypothetical protein